MADGSHVVLVTGAAGNLGRAVAEILAASGASIVAIDRTEAPLREVIDALPDAARHISLAGVDLMDAAACEAAIAAVQDRYGRIDGVVHTVGGFAAAPFSEAAPAMWEQMFRLNVLTTVNVFRAVLPGMLKAGAGSLVGIGAMAALKAPAELAAYAASKGSVLKLVESLAAEVKSSGVRVNAILPGTIDTPQNRAAMPGADTSGWVAPAQLAQVAAYLLSDAASGVTGALVPVTGRG